MIDVKANSLYDIYPPVVFNAQGKRRFVAQANHTGDLWVPKKVSANRDAICQISLPRSLDRFRDHPSYSLFVMSRRGRDANGAAAADDAVDQDDVQGAETNFEITRTWDAVEEDVGGNLIVTSVSEAEKRKRYGAAGIKTTVGCESWREI